ncbi:hypothetical protein AnigIFM63309_004744 [Aspergillus niger]|nr:hypothetical protein AnigIFM63309_004744 [Aspergillus niger]
MVLIAKLLTLALTAAATPIFRRDAVTVQDDITQKIGPAIITLFNDVAAYPESGSNGALAIHTDFQNLVSIVNSATADVNRAGFFDDDSGTTINNYFQAVTTKLSNVLGIVKDQESDWSDSPGGTTQILDDLEALNTAFDEFADALTTMEPSSLRYQVTSIKTYLDIDFDSAIDAYFS